MTLAFTLFKPSAIATLAPLEGVCIASLRAELAASLLTRLDAIPGSPYRSLNFGKFSPLPLLIALSRHGLSLWWKNPFGDAQSLRFMQAVNFILVVFALQEHPAEQLQLLLM